eukprot:4463943-Karenia_brevis.AAC.1
MENDSRVIRRKGSSSVRKRKFAGFLLMMLSLRQFSFGSPQSRHIQRLTKVPFNDDSLNSLLGLRGVKKDGCLIPNTCWHWLLGARGCLRLGAWNARGLLHNKPSKRRRKLGVVSSHLSKLDVLALQEIHGTMEELDVAFMRFAATRFA